MKSALIHLVIACGQYINAYYTDPDRESVELLSAITRWLEVHMRDIQ